MILKSKNLFLMFLFFLFIALAISVFGHEGFASKIINFDFFLLIIATVVYLMELRNEK